MTAQDASDRLRGLLPPGSTVYTAVTFRTRRHTRRSVRVFLIRDNAPLDLSPLVAQVLGREHDDVNEGVSTDTTPAELVADLARTLGLRLRAEEL